MKPFENLTKQGYEIVSKLREENGRLHIIFKRFHGYKTDYNEDFRTDYNIGFGYDEETGTWDQGEYDHKTLAAATASLIKQKFPDPVAEREHELLDNCLNKIARIVSDAEQDLYDVLSYSIGMSDEEIERYDLSYCLAEEDDEY